MKIKYYHKHLSLSCWPRVR